MLGNNDDNLLSILAIGFIWGVTNPFLRKGSEEVEGKEALKRRLNFDKDILDSSSDSDDCSSGSDDCSSDDIEIASQESQFDSMDEKDSLVIGNKKFPTSYGSWRSKMVSYGSIIKEIGKTETEPMIDDITASMLTTLSPATPQLANKSFIDGVAETLGRFRSPKVAIPFLLNQTSAFFYFKLIATSDLTSAAYCNALAMVFSTFTGYLLGERMDKPITAFFGCVFISIGVITCIISNEVENSIIKQHHEAAVNVVRTLMTSSSFFVDLLQLIDQSIIHVTASPYICWYAMCILHYTVTSMVNFLFSFW